MDHIDADIIKCCLEFSERVWMGIEFDPDSLLRWENAKRRDPVYSRLCEAEDIDGAVMTGLISIEGFMPIMLKDAVLNHMVRYIFTSIEASLFVGYRRLGFQTYTPGKTAKAVSVTTPFSGHDSEMMTVKTLKYMASMCDSKAPCTWFREFVYSMFPRKKRTPCTVLRLGEHAPEMDVGSLAKLYLNNETGFNEIPDKKQSSLTLVKGNDSVVVFVDGPDVTIIPTELDPDNPIIKLVIQKGPNLLLIKGQKPEERVRELMKQMAQRGVARLAPYVYVVKYDYYDASSELWHMPIVMWMGFPHSFGISYERVSWNVDHSDDTREERINRAKQCYSSLQRVFKDGTDPLLLSRIFWGLMHANSSGGFADGISPKGVQASKFIAALSCGVEEALTNLTAAVVRGGAKLMPNHLPNNGKICHNFQVGGKTFGWKWAKSLRGPVSFGYLVS